MELKNFLIFLKGHKIILLTIPLLAIVIAFLFVHRLPNTFVSKTQIVTGIVDQTQQVIESQEGYGRESKNNEQFVSLLETLQLDKVLDQVSFQLLNHDLTQPKPFRNPSVALDNLSPASKKEISDVLVNKQKRFDLLNLNNAKELAIDSLVRKMGYDHATLLKKNLRIYHAEGSDFINIECESENALLSAFIVNNLSNTFINYYTDNINHGHNKSADFLGALLIQKRDAMNKKIANLQDFKVKNGILDMANESKDVYEQISDLETHQQQAQKDVIAYSGALKSINKKFDPKDRQYFESSAPKVNTSIISTRERLKAVNDKYIQNNFDPKYKKNIDSLQNSLSSQINESADKYILNPLAAKTDIVAEKLKMENELELARYSSTSLDKQLRALQNKISGLVPAQAAVSSYERDIDVATKEYLSVQDKYSQANLSITLPVQLRQLQSAMPGELKDSKKMLLVVLSGITGFIICVIALLLVFYFDTAIRTGEDLENKTQIAVIGHLNFLPNIKSGLRIKSTEENGISIFKDLLRSIRFEIDNEFQNKKILAITSLNGSEGKTLFAFSLAYAYAMINKNVLLIDGNFNNPGISQTVKSKEFLEDYFTERDPENFTNPGPKQLISGEEMRLKEISSNTTVGGTIKLLNEHANLNYEHKAAITILGNKGGDVSLLEISNQENIKDKLEHLKSKYDIILIETGSLSTFNKSKEWMQFADKTIAVFENNTSLGNAHKRQLKYLKSLNGNLIGWVLNKVNINYSDSAIN